MRLDTAAIEGYEGAECRYLQTSPNWYAYQLGAYLKRSGRSRPADVRMSRGCTVRVKDMLFRSQNADCTQWERER